MKSRYYWPFLLTLLAGCSLLLVAGCGVEPAQTTSPVSTPTGAKAPTPVQPEASETPAPTQDDQGTMNDSPIPQAASLIEQARQDLRSRLQIEDNRINLKSVEAVQWRDSSLGCPQPGMNYLTVITPGFQIILSAEGQEYDYHTDLQRAILCQP